MAASVPQRSAVPAWGSGRSPVSEGRAAVSGENAGLVCEADASRPRRARARLAGAEWGFGVPAQRPRGFGAQPRLGRPCCGPGRECWTRAGPTRHGQGAHVRASRARSGALGSPRSARGGSGRSPVSEGRAAVPGENAGLVRGRRVTAKARTCAPRGRGVGLWGPRAAPAGVRGAAPSRKAVLRSRARMLDSCGADASRPRRARARLAGAEWGFGVPAQRPRGFGAQPRLVNAARSAPRAGPAAARRPPGPAGDDLPVTAAGRR